MLTGHQALRAWADGGCCARQCGALPGCLPVFRALIRAACWLHGRAGCALQTAGVAELLGVVRVASDEVSRAMLKSAELQPIPDGCIQNIRITCFVPFCYQAQQGGVPHTETSFQVDYSSVSFIFFCCSVTFLHATLCAPSGQGHLNRPPPLSTNICNTFSLSDRLFPLKGINEAH